SALHEDSLPRFCFVKNRDISGEEEEVEVEKIDSRDLTAISFSLGVGEGNGVRDSAAQL
ncbi:hypothetical protein Dimus_018498, partial [Dionaea muscipula]